MHPAVPSRTATAAPQPSALGAACSAAAVTIPHAVGLGLLAFAPLAVGGGDGLSLSALALWSAALPGLLLTLLLPRAGVVYAPTTVVALLFAAVLATMQSAAANLALAPRQVLAVAGAVVALAFALQWVLGVLRMGALVRFLPISVTHGFAAGVGLSMVLGELRRGFGAGPLGQVEPVPLAWHAFAAAAVVAITLLLRWRWPRAPALLLAVGVVAVAILAATPAGMGLGAMFVPAAPAAGFQWPMLPQWGGIPWALLLRDHGVHLALLAVLMALVNSLGVLVFLQELELEHGLRGNANQALRRESLVGVACALAGMIPASTNASRSRIALAAAGPSHAAPRWHAALLLAVAVSGAWWLHGVAMAALAGALVAAGLLQVPALLYSRAYLRRARAGWMQAWIVALVFAGMGGVPALVAGLVVATVVLLRESAFKVLRHVRLEGELRSRRLRRAASEAWLAPRMRSVAVFELQGVMSFGVAAHLAELVRAQIDARHRWVILDATRVPAWDGTALAQVRALARDLAQRGVACAVAALDPAAQASADGVRSFPDLDRALEWAESALLAERPASQRPRYPEGDLLGEAGEGMEAAAREALEALLTHHAMPADQPVFLAGDRDRDLLIVQEGHVTLATQWPPGDGMRLATVGPGMVFGEMAFLSAAPRTACAGADGEPAALVRLSRVDFDAWAQQYPAQALTMMNNLAHVGARRLAATTRQLRAVLE